MYGLLLLVFGSWFLIFGLQLNVLKHLIRYNMVSNFIQRAKQGADEAEEMPDVTEAVTILDVKAAIRESGFEKWQQRWEASSTGRHLFEFRESVRARSMKSTDIKHQKIITQLRTGYCTLNEYKYKTWLKDSPDCICGKTESVRHYIEDCFFLSFSLSLLVSLKLEHYTRECEFRKFGKKKKKLKTKNKKKHTKKTNLWLNFCLNKECPKLLCGLGIGHRRQTINSNEE